MKRLMLFIAASLVAVAGSLLIFSSGNPVLFLNSAHPAVVVISFTAGLIVSSFLFSVITGDYSWIDRLWSIAPVTYAWYYAWRGDFTLPVTTITIIITLWGIRLTFNFARRGGYTSMEDYRWPILREKISHPVAWYLFDFFFISSFQLGLFALFTLPVMAVMQVRETSPLFAVFCALAIIFLVLETAADQQQWDFHRAKQMKDSIPDSLKQYEQDVQEGFLSSGLFRFSRHPNYFGELGFWWSVYCAAASALGEPFHWSGIGVVLLSLLFVGSTRFTESITASKYPGYREYQRKTSPVVPWFPRE